MGKNPYEEEKKEEYDFFENEKEKSLENPEEEKGEELSNSKNPYANGTYAVEEKEPLKKGENPYEKTEETQAEKTDVGEEVKPRKKGCKKAVLAVILGVLLFFAGGFTTWFALGEETRAFLKVKFLIENVYYEDIDTEDFYGVVFDSINNDLLDPYSRYMTPDEYESMQEQSTGARSGLGITFLIEQGVGREWLRVVQVSGNSPAEKAGLTSGVYVVGYGKTQGNITDCVDFDSLFAFIESCETGEVFYLQTLEADGQTKLYSIAKEYFVENYVFYRSARTAYRFTGEDATILTEGGLPLSGLDDNTAYIRLTQFNGSAVEEFDQAMEVFRKEGKTDLVLDLRNNGGGSLDILCEIAKYFCKDSTAKRPLVAKGVYRHYEEKYKAPKNVYEKYFSETSRIYVLADNATASASEALIGCMLDYGATAYSQICLSYRDGQAKTFGKGIMQMTLPLLFGQDALKLTVAKIVWPKSGNCIHGRGILPTDGTRTVEEYLDDDKEIETALSKLLSASGGGFTPVSLQ